MADATKAYSNKEGGDIVEKTFKEIQSKILLDINALNHKRFFEFVDMMDTQTQVIKASNPSKNSETYSLSIEADASVGSMIKDFCDIRAAQQQQHEQYKHTERRFVIFVFALLIEDSYIFTASLMTVELKNAGDA
jgi:hypothetical protein